MQTGSDAGSSLARISSPSHRFRRSSGSGQLPGRPSGGGASLAVGKIVMVTGVPTFGIAPRASAEAGYANWAAGQWRTLWLRMAASAHSSRGMAMVAGAISCGPSLPAKFTPSETCRHSRPLPPVAAARGGLQRHHPGPARRRKRILTTPMNTIRRLLWPDWPRL